MDASDGANKNGNGHADPAPASLPSAEAALSGAPVPSASAAPAAGAPEPLVVIDNDPARDPKTGQIRKGHTLNARGRKPGVPNRNKQLLARINKTKLQGMTFEDALILEAFRLSNKKDDPTLLIEILKRTYLNVTPESSGIVINNNANANSNSHSEAHADFGELLQHRGTRDAVAELTRQLASSGAFSRGGRLGN